MPTLAWWPGTIQPGTETSETAIGIDIVPTMLDFAEIQTDVRFDGVSIKPVLLGGELAPRTLFWRNSGLSPTARSLDCRDSSKAIRDGKWKLIASPYYERLELYDLEADLAESTNVAARHPERVARMKAKLQAWEQEMVALLPYKILPQDQRRTRGRQRD